MGSERYQPFPDISAWAAVPFDSTTYDQYSLLLEQARAEATGDACEHAVKTAMRYAGTDTGAIEGLYATDRGFTRTVAIEAAGWEAAANERGTNAAQLIKDQIDAYEWVLDLVTQSRPVTEHVIRELHVILCRSQDTYVVHTEVGRQERPLPKGAYKEFPNNPTSLATGEIHHYAPPDMVTPEMGRLVGSLSTGDYLNAHPVTQAAYLHYTLAAIHPFADGNGRTTRALASVPLFTALRIPLVILRDRRDEYLDTLARADLGDLAPFLTFIGERVREAADLVAVTTRLGRAADRHMSLAALALAGGTTAAEVDAAGTTVLGLLNDELREQVAELSLPYGVQLQIVPQGTPGMPIPPGYRPIVTPRNAVALLWNTMGSVSVTHAAVLVPTEPAAAQDLVIAASAHDTVQVSLPLSDVRPEVREVARIKISAWVSHLIDIDLARLAQGQVRR